MKYIWPAGSTSKTTLLFIQDSASTTGAGQVSVSAGNIVAQEIRVLTNNTVAIATVSVTNLTALTDAYLSGGVFPVSSTLAPGWYRFDIPNSALSTGATTAGINIMGSLSASNIAQLVLEIQLQNVPSDMVAKAGVSVTVSTLFPVVVRQWDATSVSSSNLAVTDFSTRVNANVQQWAGTSVTTGNIALWQSVSTANVTQWAGNATSLSDVAIQDTTDSRFNVNVSAWQGVSVSTANIALWQSVSTANVTQWAGNATSLSDVAIQDTGDSRLNVNVAAWQGVSVSTNNIALRSEISLSVVNVTAWAGVSVSTANIALWQSISAANVTQWATTSVSGSNLAIVDFSTRVNANVQQWSGKSTSTSDLAAFSVSQTVLTSATVGGSVDVGTWRGITVSASNIAIKNTLAKTTHITGFNDISQQTVSSVVFGSAMTESYAADGAEFTIPQGLYQIWSRLAEFSTSAQVITAMKLDGATTAMTFSLDSDTAPSKIERAT